MSNSRSKEFKVKWKAKFIEVLEANSGNIAASLETCKKMFTNPVARSTMFEWRKVDAEFDSKINDIREKMLDNVESAVYKSALEGNITAQIFMLKTQGAKRGWVEKQIIGTDDDSPLQIEIIRPNG